MATGSAIPAAIDALIAWATAALPDVDVVDGPGRDGAPSKNQVLHVGLSDPYADTFDEAASSDQGWAWLGHIQRDETLTVHAVAIAWNGEGNQKSARDAVYAIVSAFAAQIQADPTLNDSVLAVTEVSPLSLRQIQNPDGAAAYIPIDITCRARLG